MEDVEELPRESAWNRSAVAMRTAAWKLLLNGCRRSGAAFIKWGQVRFHHRDNVTHIAEV